MEVDMLCGDSREALPASEVHWPREVYERGCRSVLLCNVFEKLVNRLVNICMSAKVVGALWQLMSAHYRGTFTRQDQHIDALFCKEQCGE